MSTFHYMPKVEKINFRTKDENKNSSNRKNSVVPRSFREIMMEKCIPTSAETKR
jgi:hypothetical protein